VELFEQIRRAYKFGIETIVGVAKKLSVHWRMVREAIGSALPRPRKKPERPRWKLKAAVQFVDAILEADRKAPRKTTTHGAPDLDADAARVARVQDRGTAGSRVRARPESRIGADGARDLYATELRLGRGCTWSATDPRRLLYRELGEIAFHVAGCDFQID